MRKIFKIDIPEGKGLNEKQLQASVYGFLTIGIQATDITEEYKMLIGGLKNGPVTSERVQERPASKINKPEVRPAGGVPPKQRPDSGHTGTTDR